MKTCQICSYCKRKIIKRPWNYHNSGFFHFMKLKQISSCTHVSNCHKKQCLWNALAVLCRMIHICRGYVIICCGFIIICFGFIIPPRTKFRGYIGITLPVRLSVRLSVRPSVCLSVCLCRFVSSP